MQPSYNCTSAPRKRASSNSQTVTRAQVRQMIASSNQSHIERKFADDSEDVGISYNGQTNYLLSNLSRGDTATTCTGNLLRVKRIEVRGLVYTNQTYSTVRLVLFSFDDSAAPTTSGILESVGGSNAPYSPLNITNFHKIHVLDDRLINIFPVAGSYASKEFVMDISCNILVQLPVGTLPTSAAQLKGIYLTMVSDDGAPSYPVVQYASRITFEDA